MFSQAENVSILFHIAFWGQGWWGVGKRTEKVPEEKQTHTLSWWVMDDDDEDA